MSDFRPGGQVYSAHPGDPRRIGPYRIIGRLGSGGMGTVHAGLDSTGQRVAVKVIHPVQAQDPEFRARFRREVQLSARVQGPCLIPLLAADPDADAPWLATAYVPGPTLDQHLAAHGPLADSTLYAFAAGTTQALTAIHAAGVIHRDVKPQNVILAPSGPHILDFGIAHALDGTSVTRTGVMTGTPGWISPEHYRTGTAGPEGDVFAWGALVAYAATGRPPFGTGAPDAVAYRVLSEEPDLRGLPGDLRELVAAALAKAPGDRPTSSGTASGCVALLSARTTQVVSPGTNPTLIGDLVAGQWRVPPPADPSWEVSPPPARRRALVAGVAIVTFAVSLVGGFVTYDARGNRAGTDRAAGPSATSSSPQGGPVTGAGATGAASRAAVSAAPASTTSSPLVDPRTVRVPTDPLVGVTSPAYTRADDADQPHPAEWQASTTATGPEESEVARNIRGRVHAVLATKDLAFMKPEVTFNRRAQTVFVTGGPISQLPDEYREVFQRAGEMAACATLAHRLHDTPATWPYGRFAIHWKTFEGDLKAPIIGYGEATDGCFTEIAGQWRGDEAGLATAGIPSGDKAEIRVADATVKAITADWNADIADTGEEVLHAVDGLRLGFDPVENAAYVWTNDPRGRFASRASQSNLSGTVEERLCRALAAEFHADASWPYIRWALAVHDEYTRTRQFISSGTCPT